MAKSDKIIVSRKRKLLLDNDIYELDPEDRSPVESPLAIISQPSDEDVIALDTSQEAGTFDNLSESDNFGKTVRPDDTPKGYILIDEDLGIDDADKLEKHNDTPLKTLSPIFEVMFRDIDVAREHRQTIKEFLQNLLAKNAKVKSETDSSGLILKIWDQQEALEDGEIFGSTEPEENQETFEDQLFTIDAKPKLQDDLDIPTYGKKFAEMLEKPAEDDATSLPEEFAPRIACYNCLGNHNLRDCTKPRNQTNINKHRKEFSAKAGPKYGRYYIEDEQKFGHFVPGQLSKNLRRALGIRDNELPRHIYSMRMLGYPPGWIEEARVHHSGLTLFNSDGYGDFDAANVKDEIIVHGQNDEFDIAKIHDFPGFNVAPPHGTRDEYKYYGTPRMQEMHSKEVLLSTLMDRKTQDGYKKRKMKVARSGTVENASVVPSEMEVVDAEESVVETLPVDGLFIPPLPQDTPQKPPEPPTQLERPQSPDSIKQSPALSPRPNSPSLSDLEIAKKLLLAELVEPGTPSTPGMPINLGKTSNLSETLDESHMPPPPNTELTPQSSRRQSSQDSSMPCDTGTVKSTDLGTPILQSKSPYNKLPSSEKFSKDVCDVMNFENLPDSTGTYEKMSGVIRKVRDVVSRIQQE